MVRSASTSHISTDIFVPSAGRSGPDDGPRAPSGPRLRLSLGKGRLGLELESEVAVGPFVVTELSVELTGIRFPIDLSGGVSRFRHIRGELERLSLHVTPQLLADTIAPRLRALWGGQTPTVRLVPNQHGVEVGVNTQDRALAFDLVVAPVDEDIRLIPQRARGVGLEAPPHVLALRVVSLACGRLAQDIGGAFVIRRAASAIARAIMPEAGARVPATPLVRFVMPTFDAEYIKLFAARDGELPELSEEAIRAVECVALTAAADRAAQLGQLDEARSHLMDALERAPRHPEIAMRAAAIDRCIGGRAEAALSTLSDALGAVDAGSLGGDLLAEVHDLHGAVAAFVSGAHAEPMGALSAQMFVRAAALVEDRVERISLLDQAVARMPALSLPRWARLRALLSTGDIQGARADAEHLEAAAKGRAQRHETCARIAETMAQAGQMVDARAYFERALRYLPDDPVTVSGLARTLKAMGYRRRALELSTRAVALADRRGTRTLHLELDLARDLAEIAEDLPAAVARVRQIPDGTEPAFAARLMEARWRAQMMDLAGAKVALGRLVEAVVSLGDAIHQRADTLFPLLREAAEIEEDQRQDLLGAQRIWALLVRLRPRDRRVSDALARVSRAAQGPREPWGEPTTHSDGGTLAMEPDAADRDAADTRRPTALNVDFGSPDQSSDVDSDAEDELLTEQLTDRLRANPADQKTALALADVLERRGKDLDLFALLAARWEDAEPHERQALVPRRVAVLNRLANAAREGGSDVEAELYEQMLSDLQ